LGRFRDLLRSDDPSFVGSVDASYPGCSPDLWAPVGAPPPHADVFDPSFALAEPALSLTNTSTSTLPGWLYHDPSQFCPLGLPAVASLQLLAVPGLHSAIDTGLNFPQAAVGPPLDDGMIDFIFESPVGSNDAISDCDQLALGLESQHHSPASDPSSPTSEARSTSYPLCPNGSSLASSSCGSSPAARDPTNSNPGVGDAFSCRQCRKKCGDRAKLKLHARYHGNKEHGCSIAGCDKRFNTKQDLDRHQRTISHGGRKGFRCSRCQTAFSRKDNLQRHERNVHEVDLLKGRGYITLGP